MSVTFVAWWGVAASAADPVTRPTARKPTVRVCYVISTGGSMVGVFGQVKTDLKIAVDALRAGQSVGVFFTSADGVVSPKRQPRGGLVPVTDDATAAIDDLADAQVAVGGTAVATGLRAALATHPDVIWVITNGFDGNHDHAACLAVARQMNAARHARINTSYRYTSAGDADGAARTFLFDLANANGGVCLGSDGKPLGSLPKPPTTAPAKRPRPPRPAGPNVLREP